MPRKKHNIFVKKRALVLNADYTPISLISCKHAIVLDWKERITIVDFYKNDYILTAGDIKYPIPAVVALKQYISRENHKGIPFSRKNIYIRDKMTCQYCGKKKPAHELTYDHLCPRAKWKGPGTPTSWTNIVTSCYPCNLKKADYHIDECDGKNGRPNISLIKYPQKPSPAGYILGLAPWTKLEKEWKTFLPKSYIELLSINNEE